jgi:HAD superfamily hydrolase (TIGR01509 family)
MDVPAERPPPHGPVLFDMDGVLVDSETYWHRFEDEWVFETAVADGLPAHEEVTGMPYDEIYDYLEAEYGTTVTKAAFVETYEERAESLYGEQVVLTEGMAELFDRLRGDGRAVGIVSSSPSAWIDIVRRRFDLGALDVVVSGEDIDDPGKPAPHIYEHAAAVLGVTPSECVVVEDSQNGIAAAVSAGAFTIAYRSTHNAELDLSRADVVVDSPEGVASLLLE